MPFFASELNAAWRKRAKELGRDPTPEEGEVIEAELVEAWISAQRFDELITRFLSEYGREGGNLDLIILGHALRQRKDAARIHKLFRSVVNNRGDHNYLSVRRECARKFAPRTSRTELA
jgi:hypothetical protein